MEDALIGVSLRRASPSFALCQLNVCCCRSTADQVRHVPGVTSELSAEAQRRRGWRGHNPCAVKLRQSRRRQARNAVSVQRHGRKLSLPSEGHVCLRGDWRRRCLFLWNARPGIWLRLPSAKYSVGRFFTDWILLCVESWWVRLAFSRGRTCCFCRVSWLLNTGCQRVSGGPRCDDGILLFGPSDLSQ